MNVLQCTQLLGVPFHPGLTEGEVRQAWKRSSLAAHPDKGGAEPLFHQLTAARDGLLLWLSGQQASATEAAAAAAAQRQRAEKQVCTALATLAKVQREWPPERGHVLGLTEQTAVGSSQAVSVPVLHISSSDPAWSRVLTPTGHLLSGPNGRQDHNSWCLPQALSYLLQRFPAAAGYALQCSPEGIRVLQHAGSPQQQSSSLITPAQLAAGSSQWEQSIQFHPAPAQPAQPQAGSGPATPAARVPPHTVQPGVTAAQHSAAQRAAAIIAAFQLVFSSEQLLVQSGRRSSVGSEVCLDLYSQALEEMSTHYSLPPPPQAPADAASSGDSGWPAAGQAVLLAAVGSSGGLKDALPALAAELIQRLLPQLVQHPAGLPACLVPDTGKDGRGVTSIICCCRRFGATPGCLARFAPGVSVHGLYVEGIGHSRSCPVRSKDGFRCTHCQQLAPVGVKGAKRPASREGTRRPAAHEGAAPALPADPLLRARQLLTTFRQAVGTGCNPFYASLPAADGSERCAAGSARSACARAAACAYFDALVCELGAGADERPGHNNGTSSSRAAAQDIAGRCAPGPSLAGDGGSEAAAMMAGAAQEFVRLAAVLPQLASTLRQCSRRTDSCCGVGPRAEFVRCLQSFGVLAPECCACFDATFAPAGC